MQNAAKRKSISPPALTALWTILLLVVTLCLGQTRVLGFAVTPQPASGIFAPANPSSIGENYDGCPYDASDSLLAAKTIPTGPKAFAMGIDDHLDDFARQNGATTWKNFDDVTNWKPQVMDRLADLNQKVLFNLDGVDVWGGVQRGASGRGGATDWELFQLRQNPSFPNVEFRKGGQQVPNPFQ